MGMTWEIGKTHITIEGFCKVGDKSKCSAILNIMINRHKYLYNQYNLNILMEAFNYKLIEINVWKDISDQDAIEHYRGKDGI